MAAPLRNLVVILGDQLDHQSAAFENFDAKRDTVWMAEVSAEATYVLSHKVRIAYFLTAMRHFAAQMRKKKYRIDYTKLNAPGNNGALDTQLKASLQKLRPETIVVVEPGEYRIEQMLQHVSQETGIPLDIRPDLHFYCSREEFREYTRKHPTLRMEFFYRDMRRKTGILMDRGKPSGGDWNYDAENRQSFGHSGPGLLLPKPVSFPPDRITSEVLKLVEAHFSKHPGTLSHFELPVTSADAQLALDDFVANRLPDFGRFQDAMWTDEPFLYHSRISATMNLKLLNPRTVMMAVQEAFEHGHVPLAAAEGYIRQVIGWREYIRGVYWTFMPEYIGRNALGATEKLPDLYWDGKTDMHCLEQAVAETLEYGYAHHIQRLMVTGLFSLLFGVDPVEIHKWYLAIYWDAVEWVEMPNVVGMSQFADGGLMGSKPYIASGKYIDRMSNYCKDCRYDPNESLGERACPFTTLYWDFLMRHEQMLSANQRMRMQVRNLARISTEKKQAIRQQATNFRHSLPKGKY